MPINPILNTDSYKQSHFAQYPPGAEVVSSYVESRGGDFKQTVFFGLQAFLKDYLSQPVTTAHIEEAEAICRAHMVPFNRDGWQYIVERHDGRLPVLIEAVPEGTVLPMRNVLAQCRNTDPNVPWLTSFLETALLRAIWYPTTVATLSWHIRQLTDRYLDMTSDAPDAKRAVMLNDFGARGVSSLESSGLGGLAHLVSFQGTDNMAALLAARRFYGVDLHTAMPAYSVPAAEHSTVTSWGGEREMEAYRHIVQAFAFKFPLISVVSDSYDIVRACREIWGEQLQHLVETCGSTVVIRPDSGDPVTMVVDVISILMERFGYEVNSKGYRVLPDCVRVIQGDGINQQSIEEILVAMEDKKLSADNIAFGMGGGLLQQLDRDTLRFAMKASAIRIGGTWHDVFKRPKSDPSKASKRGVLALTTGDDGGFETVRADALGAAENVLRPVFENGDLLIDHPFDDVRARAGT